MSLAQVINPAYEQVRVLDRQLEFFNRKLGEFLPLCRAVYLRRDPLNVRIGVDSVFAEQILGAMGRTIFPGFETRQSIDAAGLRWSHFGYQ